MEEVDKGRWEWIRGDSGWRGGRMESENLRGSFLNDEESGEGVMAGVGG